jgi:drug/metabolite transporter (DMT)-like permease
VFVAPVWLSDYPADILSFGRYLAFGVIAVFLAMGSRAELTQLTKADWIEALRLALVGNIIYYCCLAGGIQLSGAPTISILIGTLPIVIAITANALARSHQSIPWSRLALPLGLILIGLALVNYEEFHRLTALSQSNAKLFGYGIALGVCALVAWTWYPLRNSAWLAANPQVSGATWATAQGLATLPLALLGYAASYFWSGASFEWPLGPTPVKFVGLMLLLGFLASWLGTLWWNRASQLLPASLAGQLIVFETLSALAYAYLVRGTPPHWSAGFGIIALIAGVVVGVRAFNTGHTGQLSGHADR